MRSIIGKTVMICLLTTVQAKSLENSSIATDAQIVARLSAIPAACSYIFRVDKPRINALVEMRIKSALKRAKGETFFALGAELTKQYSEQIAIFGNERWCVQQKAELDLIGVRILGSSCFKEAC